jgi:hypothetical protein
MVLFMATVNEGILLQGVAMEVADHLDLKMAVDVRNHPFDMIDLREHVLVKFIPGPVEISTRQRAPGVPV